MSPDASDLGEWVVCHGHHARLTAGDTWAADSDEPPGSRWILMGDDLTD